MVVDPNSFRAGYFSNSHVENLSPSFLDTMSASLGYNYAPVANMVSNSLRYSPQEGYDWRDDIGEYKSFASHLYQASSPEHMAALKSQIDDSIARRETLANSSMLAQFGAGIFDPINLVALPFGGPTIGIGRSALRMGAGVAALETGLEAARQTDPLQTAQEGALNIASAAMFGAGFGAAFGGANARAYSNLKRGLDEEFAMHRRLDLLSGVTPEEVQVPRSERVYGNYSDEDLQIQINHFQEQADKTRREATSYDERNRPDFEARAEELQGYADAYKKELGIRELESLGDDLSDPYRIMNSAYTDSFLYKAVSTPMKRALQSKYPTAVKEKFVKSFSDSGIALALNSVGMPTPQSVAQMAATSQGRWVRSHDQLLKLWQESTNAIPTNRLDINVADVTRRVTRSKDTYKSWLSTISEKRIKGLTDEMTEAELKASNIIEEYFENARVRLEDVGLIGTEKGVNNRIKMLEAKVQELNAAKTVAEGKSTKRAKREVLMLEERLQGLGRVLAEEKQTQLGLQDLNPNSNNEDVFFPRFWDKGAIRKRRADLFNILKTWYTANPEVIDFDSKTATFVKKQLAADEKLIEERVNLTIDRILGESDPTNVDRIAFGHGRSKHFRHRQVDIPNKLVTDFIVTDPLAVMQTYASRIEPRYEYARMFGDSVDGVLSDMELEMVRKGMSDKDINRMRRDYRHMYDRVGGALRRDPDSWDQKAAQFLRDAASFSYMGSAGLAALPDFGRIVMEHDMETVLKGMQALMDKNTVKLGANEVRYAGEAIDILRGSAHLRLMDDLSNNIDGNELLNTARNAFYIANGLAPMTVIAKQLAGIVDAHTIIDYSIRYSKLTDQERTWMAKYGIGADDAAKIAKAPWQKTENGLYLANSDAWSDLKMDDILSEVKATYKPSKKPIASMTEAEMLKRYQDEFKVDTIITDPAIVQDVLRKNGIVGGMGYSMPYQDMPSTVYLDVGATKAFHKKIMDNPRSKQESLDKFKDLFDRSIIDETKYYHSVNIIENADLIETADEFVEFVMLHELHHTTMPQKADETIAQYEDRVDRAAFDYMRSALESGQQRAADKIFDARKAEAEELTTKFRTALNSGVLNTIMAATPADKPIINDGIVYIPSHIGRMFGFAEDAKYKGYTRIENGFLGLPFQFYSYVLANVNKTVGALAQGQIKQRMLGVSVSMGLAYMSLSIRTPDFAWEEMTWRDKFARSFDMSGIMALYSDLFYTSMHTSLALGGPNITAGLLSPKFPQQPSALDAVTGIAGAGPSWAADMFRGTYNVASGEYGEGFKEIARNLPFTRMWFLKDDVNQITRAWAQ